MKNTVIPVPIEIDVQIAKDALKAMDVQIDNLNKKQIDYQNSWN